VTRTEHLLVILMEECAEVQQRASKALRFGLSEVQPGQTKTNAERLAGELADLQAAEIMLFRDGLVGAMSGERISAKREQVERFLRYSAECGTLEENCEAKHLETGRSVATPFDMMAALKKALAEP
jgi:hypothetical protein